jgi:hypothetical protein
MVLRVGWRMTNRRPNLTAKRPGKGAKGPMERASLARPGGEPLYKVAALSVSSRRLPGMTQRKILPIASIVLWRCNGR